MYNTNFLATRLAEAGSNRLNSPFIDQPDLGRVTTFADFFLNAERIAQVLVDQGVTPGDRVLVYAPKSATCIELYFACLIAGAVYTSINPAIPFDDVDYFVNDAQPALIVTDAERYAAVFRNRTDWPKALTVNADETGTLVQLRDGHAGGFTAIARNADDPAAILYTSGTTGRPKGVVHSHSALWSNADVLRAYWQFTADDVLLHCLPIFHLHGLFTAMNVLLASGASCKYIPAFERDAILNLMPGATVMMGVPPYYMALLDDPRLSDAARGMRVFISGSAPMLPQTHAQWRAATGTTILERYGMTECSMIASNPYDAERRPNSVGFPLPGTEVRIVDIQSGAPLSAGEIGMIEVRGPNLFSGYWQKPEKTAEDMQDDGFFISGDFGKYDADGYLYVIGRVKDAVISPDGIVFPKKVEEQIDALPGIAESAVVSVPHPERTAVPVAIIVANGDAIAEEIMRDALQGQLAAHEVPARFITVGELPRNAMGKVQKVTLRAQYDTLFSVGS